jgi:hypothetical protein
VVRIEGITGSRAATSESANAATVTPNPMCAVPAGVTYQLVHVNSLTLTIAVYEYEAFSNGVYYNGADFVGLPPGQAKAAGFGAACSTSSTQLY